ncbi:MAG: insulinase family protein [Chloroflexi bacterium]|nr:insulinase family protein [Chloroflexota bacterium]
MIRILGAARLTTILCTAVLAGLALGVAVGGTVNAAVRAADEPDVYRTVLPNGLRAVVRERPESEVTAISVGIRGGSRDERRETVGAAHFMEHMFFQGTPRRPDAADLDRELEARGGWTNAWTGWESINFQVVTATEDFELGLDVIADQMAHSLFAAEKIDKERRVVLEELNGRNNSPTSKAYDIFLVEVFGDHPARNLPIGNRQTINSSTREVLVGFRDTYFVAGNMVVAVVGNVKHDEVFAKLATAFADLRTGAVPPKNVAAVPPAEPRMLVDQAPGQQARIIMGGPTVGYDSKDRYVFDVLDAILGESGRRLERELVDTQAIASSAYPFYLALTDVGVWGVSAGARPSNVDRVMETIKAELRALREQPVEADELAEAKAYIRGRLLLNRERSVDLAEELSDGEALGTYEPLSAYLAAVDAVTSGDIQRVARTHMDPDRLTVTVLRP